MFEEHVWLFLVGPQLGARQKNGDLSVMEGTTPDSVGPVAAEISGWLLEPKFDIVG